MYSRMCDRGLRAEDMTRVLGDEDMTHIFLHFRSPMTIISRSHTGLGVPVNVFCFLKKFLKC